LNFYHALLFFFNEITGACFLLAGGFANASPHIAYVSLTNRNLMQPVLHTEKRNIQGEWSAASQFAKKGGQTKVICLCLALTARNF